MIRIVDEFTELLHLHCPMSNSPSLCRNADISRWFLREGEGATLNQGGRIGICRQHRTTPRGAQHLFSTTAGTQPDPPFRPAAKNLTSALTGTAGHPRKRYWRYKVRIIARDPWVE